MELDIFKASDELSKLELQFRTEHMELDVLWFRVMKETGEWAIERHRHSSYEFHFVAQGGCTVVLDEGGFDVLAGEFYLTAPGIYHTQRHNHNESYLEYSLNCDIRILDDAQSEERQLVEILKAGECTAYGDVGPILKLFDSALEEAYGKRVGFYNTIEAMAKRILIESARRISQDSEKNYDVPMKYKKHDFRFAQIHRFVKDNLDKAVNGKEIAAYMHLSEKQISRIVKTNAGIATKEYINTMKLVKSKELLRNTEMTIGEIAAGLGFSSPYYFNQFFKKYEGCPPSLFRKNVPKP